jgi:trigger factor
VKFKAVKVATEAKPDANFAKSLGLESMDQLRGILSDQLGQELNGLTRTHMKRRLLDQLAERCDFEVPASMVEAEFQNIMNQIRHEASHEPDPKSALAEIEQESDDYRDIAERRVRLGLLLSEIGSANGVEINEGEMNRLVAQAASQYQGKDRERFLQYIQQEPAAAAQLRAPLYEDKVVDFLFDKAVITERKATREELEADLESEEGHVHGPGCGHDFGEQPKKTAKAKAGGEKVAAKPKAAEQKPEPEAPSKGPVEKSAAKPKPSKPLKDAPKAKAAEAKPAKAKTAKPVKKATKATKAKLEKKTAKPAAKKAPAKKAVKK